MLRLSLRGVALGALVAGFAAASAGCTGNLDAASTSVASCAELKAQIDACGSVSQTTKDAFLAQCTKLPDSCRACFDGKLCGSTEGCERLCE